MSAPGRRPASAACAAALLAAASLQGCMAGWTRRREPTPLEPRKAAIPAALKGRRVAVSIDFDSAKVGGGHHEGLLQVRQPWIYGLSKEQKELLYGNAPKAAALSFAAELKRQGVPAYWLGPGRSAGRDELVLSGRLERVVLNTYGRGTREGFGSAGAYWEAVVRLSLSLSGPGGKPLWEGPVESYAKLSPCPAQLDWTMLTVVSKALQGSLALDKLAGAKGLAALSAGKDYAETFEASYQLDKTKTTPIEVAARHAAFKFLEALARQ